MDQSHSLYSYAFLRPDAALVLPLGFSGALTLMGDSSLVALVEPGLDVERLQAEDTQLMRIILHHDQVIREAFEQTDLLPLRFGTCFRSSADLLNHLQINTSAYLEKLKTFQGKAEYTLRLNPVMAAAPSISTETAGKAYFLAKKRQYQDQLMQQQQQQDERARLWETITQSYPYLRPGEPRDGVERIYVLSDRRSQDHLLASLPFWQELCPHWALTLDSPLPPYHFM